MNPKVFFVIVALLVIVALVGVGAGLGKSDEKLDLKFGGLDQIGASLTRDQALTASDITNAIPASCLDLFKNGSLELKALQSCAFTVGASERPSRKVSVSTPAGQNLSVMARMPVDKDNQLTINKTLAPPAPAELQFFKEGGNFSITCLTHAGNGKGQVTGR